MLGMSPDTDPNTVLTAIGAALKQIGQTEPENAPKVAQAAPEINQLSVVLASALKLPSDASNDEIVTALLERDATPAVTTATAQPDERAFIPITAVATFVADAEKKRHEENVEQVVTAAMQAGRLPPALEDWGRDLCRDKPEEFDRFLSSSPFNISGSLSAMFDGTPPATASALSPTQDAADAITAQLDLPQG